MYCIFLPEKEKKLIANRLTATEGFATNYQILVTLNFNCVGNCIGHNLEP